MNTTRSQGTTRAENRWATAPWKFSKEGLTPLKLRTDAMEMIHGIPAKNDFQDLALINLQISCKNLAKSCKLHVKCPRKLARKVNILQDSTCKKTFSCAERKHGKKTFSCTEKKHFLARIECNITRFRYKHTCKNCASFLHSWVHHISVSCKKRASSIYIGLQNNLQEFSNLHFVIIKWYIHGLNASKFLSVIIVICTLLCHLF